MTGSLWQEMTAEHIRKLIREVLEEHGLVGAKPKKPKQEPASAASHEAYAQAYAKLYGVEPVRNARTNGQMAQFVSRLALAEAPLVAAFFLSHRGARYVRAMHPVGMLLQDAEKLRAEWFTGTQMTSTQAMQADRTQGNYNAFAPLIERARAEDERSRKEPQA